MKKIVSVFSLAALLVVTAFTPEKPDGGAYTERVVPVVTKVAPDSKVMLRFYEDMPNVAYINISRYHEIMYPGTTVLVQKTGEGQYALTLNLQNSLPIVAMQADIHWNPDMTTKQENISLSSRADKHQVALNRISNDTYRLYVYSTTNQVITAGQGALLTLIYNKVNSAVNYHGTTITVDNIILSTPEGQNQASASTATLLVNKKGDVNGDGLVTVADLLTYYWNAKHRTSQCLTLISTVTERLPSLTW